MNVIGEMAYAASSSGRPKAKWVEMSGTESGNEMRGNRGRRNRRMYRWREMGKVNTQEER